MTKWRTVRPVFFFSSRRRHTRLQGDWSSDVCSSDLVDALHAAHDRFDRATLVVGGDDDGQLHDLMTGVLASSTYPCRLTTENGRASGRERGEISVGAGSLKKKKDKYATEVRAREECR